MWSARKFYNDVNECCVWFIITILCYSRNVNYNCKHLSPQDVDAD